MPDGVYFIRVNSCKSLSLFSIILINNVARVLKILETHKDR
jgi:hypothetical protein